MNRGTEAYATDHGEFVQFRLDADCGLVPQFMVKSWKCAAGMSSALRGIFGALDDCESLRAGGWRWTPEFAPGVRLPGLDCIN